MKFFAFICLLCCTLQAQAQLIDFKIKFDSVQVATYDWKNLKDRIYLRNNYGAYQISNPDRIKHIKGRVIQQIDLVYTDFPKGQDMTLLTQQRLAALFLLSPDIFYNNLIHWRLVRQTDVTETTVQNAFHGFVIYYRNEDPIGVADMKDQLRKTIDGKLPVNDSTILKVMKRNEQWDSMVIVSDFTGSMSPYIGQLLLWYHLQFAVNKEKMQAFVFFNDGDTKSDAEKVMGKVGGIYHTTEMELDSVLSKALETISHGYGGDAPENDVEALIFAQKKFKDARNMVLIADNYANMRDFALIKELKKPVKVIVCGGLYVNPEYLSLAFQTKGSVHTIEEDITKTIQEMKPGQTIKIGKEVFELKEDGSFARVKLLGS